MSKKYKNITKQEKANLLEEFDYDIWINLLSPPDYAELGKSVYDRLVNTPSGEKILSRKIIVCGS